MNDDRAGLQASPRTGGARAPSSRPPSSEVAVDEPGRAATVDSNVTDAFASGPQPIDDEPTPIDPPTFDLGELVRHAEAAPARKSHVAAVANDEAIAPPDLAEGGRELPKAGEKILNYVVLGLHAQGGLSLLYEVSHLHTRQRCLIKILKLEFREADVQRDRLLAEGKLLKTCSKNPYVPDVYELGVHPLYGAYVIMELLRAARCDSLGEASRSRSPKR